MDKITKFKHGDDVVLDYINKMRQRVNVFCEKMKYKSIFMNRAEELCNSIIQREDTQTISVKDFKETAKKAKDEIESARRYYECVEDYRKELE